MRLRPYLSRVHCEFFGRYDLAQLEPSHSVDTIGLEPGYISPTALGPKASTPTAPVAPTRIPEPVGAIALAPSRPAAGIAVKFQIVAAKAREAIAKGYAGDACTQCGQFTLVRNGTCLKCDSCGTTSGCS